MPVFSIEPLKNCLRVSFSVVGKRSLDERLAAKNQNQLHSSRLRKIGEFLNFYISEKYGARTATNRDFFMSVM